MEQNFLSDFYIKRVPKSIMLPKGTFYNNPYCESIMRGLTSDVDKSWKVVDGETVFASTELKEDFLNVLNYFFSTKYKGKEPDLSGKIENGVTNMGLVSEDLALEAKESTPVERTFWMSSNTVYPVQFIVDAEKFLLDTDLPFKKKDILWFCLRPGGYILSLDAEQFGVLVTFMEDVVKRTANKSFEEKIKEMYRPTMQERIFTAFALLYKYLKDTDSLENSYYRL